MLDLFESSTYAALAVAGPAFNPDKFSIDPSNLAAAAADLAVAIKNGYGPTKAINLLENASDAADVSFDRMLLLTENKLEGLKGTAARAGEARFEDELRAHLATGEAVANLAQLVKGGDLKAVVAADTIIGMAAEVRPGAHRGAHALALLIDRMEDIRVPEAKIETIASTHATFLLSGIERQIALGGIHAPSAEDIAAAAEVMEGGLTPFTRGALYKLTERFSDFGDTAAERAALETFENLAIREASAEHQLSAPQAQRWQDAIDPPPPPNATARAVFAIADRLARNVISPVEASNALYDLAQSLWEPGTIPPLPEDIMLRASRFAMTGATAAAMSKLASAGFNNGTIGALKLNPILDNLLDVVAAPPPGKDVDARALTTVATVTLGYGFATQNEIRAAVRHGAVLADQDVDAWLLSAINTLGGRAGIGNSDANVKMYLAIADVMSDRLTSGKLASSIAFDVRHDKMTAAKAVDYVLTFGQLAMDNNGWQGSYVFVPDLVQQDRITGEDRGGIALAQLMHKLSGTDHKQAEALIKKSHLDTYIGGLGAYAMIYSGRAGNQALAEVADLITETGMPSVRAVAQGGGSDQQIFEAAQSYVNSKSEIFTQGTDVIAIAANTVFKREGEPLLGDLSFGFIAKFFDAPAAADPFIKIAVAAADHFIPLNPLAIGGAIGDLAALLVDLGVSKLLGPFAGGVLEGAVGVINSINDGIEAALLGVGNVALNAIVGAGTAVFHLVENAGNLVEGLFTGDLESAATAAGALLEDLKDDLDAAGEAILRGLENTFMALVEAANSLVDAGRQILEVVGGVFAEIGVAVAEVLGTLFT